MSGLDIDIEDREKISFLDAIDLLKSGYASLNISIVSPELTYKEVAQVVAPAPLPESRVGEYVYPIYDHYSSLSMSKDYLDRSNCKLFYTIEKMITLLMDRIQVLEGVTEETEIQIAFDGHETAKRKAFESIINLTYNVIVINFDPGVWGERYLQIVKNLADKGYGYPSKAPRDIYRKLFSTPSRTLGGSHSS